MCPQIIAGQGSDLTKAIPQLVKELLENNWPTSAYDPLKSEIDFGLDTGNNYGDIDIHVNGDKGFSTPMTLGWTRRTFNDPVLVHLYVRKNQEEIPTSMGNAQRKIEEIINDNAAALGQGVTAIRFDGWEPILIDNNLKDVWHAIGRATAIYYKVKV